MELWKDCLSFVLFLFFLLAARIWLNFPLCWPPWFMVGAETIHPCSQHFPLCLPPSSPQGSVLHRWVCSDTLVRLKSQAGFINSYSGSIDTPFCIVTKTHINPLSPGVLQNYISSYVIKSDWLHSASPLKAQEGTNCKSSVKAETAWNVIKVIGLFFFSWQTHQCLWAWRFVWLMMWTEMEWASEETDGRREEKVRAMRDIMCLWLQYSPPSPSLFLSVPRGRYVHLVSWLSPETPP